MVCTSLGSLLRPLFYFLCSILLIHRVDLLYRIPLVPVTCDPFCLEICRGRKF